MSKTEIKYDEKKLSELILYVVRELADDASFGATKLNKVLFFSDFLGYRSFGHPITGAEYMKLNYGPAPRRLLPVQQALIGEGAAELTSREYRGYTQKRLEALRGPDTSIFGEDELELVDEVIDALRGATAVQVSDMSHRLSVGWNIAGLREEIPYNTVFLSADKVSKASQKRIRDRAIELGLVA